MSRSGSICTWISRRRAPKSSTSPTPLTDSRRFCTFCSMNVVSSTTGIGADTENIRIGNESGSCFCTTGGSAVSGRSRMTGSTLARTSCAAMSAFLDRSNEIVTRERPSVEVERSSSMPDDGIDRGLDAVGDLGLDVLGRRAGVGGRDRHDRCLDARVAVDAQREERHPADDRDGRDQHRGEDRAVDADFSELLHDGACYFSSRSGNHQMAVTRSSRPTRSSTTVTSTPS